MKPKRWWSIILPMGLLMALSPFSAQAGPRGPVPQQANRQVFNHPQPRGNAFGCNMQPHKWQQPRGNPFGWNGSNHQFQQPRGHAFGWNGQPHRWQQTSGNANGLNDHQRQWDQHRNNFGGNDYQRQWQQRPAGGQQNTPGSFNPVGYPVQPQSGRSAPRPSGYSHNPANPAGQTGTQPGFHHPDASGNAPLPQGQSPAGAI